MSTKQFVVTVGDAHLPEIQQVAARLRAKGMQVDQVMEATGMISGSYNQDAADLRAVHGVVSVEEPAEFQVPPPNSQIQ